MKLLHVSVRIVLCVCVCCVVVEREGVGGPVAVDEGADRGGQERERCTETERKDEGNGTPQIRRVSQSTLTQHLTL